MNKTIKNIAVIAVVSTLSLGSVFAQSKKAPAPVQETNTAPAPAQNKAPVPPVPSANNKGFANHEVYIGTVEYKTDDTFTYIDLDGRRVTAIVTPFTEFVDYERMQKIDFNSKDAKEQFAKAKMSVNLLRPGFWVRIRGSKTEGGRLVADKVEVVRVFDNSNAK